MAESRPTAAKREVERIAAAAPSAGDTVDERCSVAPLRPFRTVRSAPFYPWGARPSFQLLVAP